jgi:hypothetical protein
VQARPVGVVYRVCVERFATLLLPCCLPESR